MPRGYYTHSCYYGEINGKFYPFPTEREYREFFEEVNRQEDEDDKKAIEANT